MRRILLIFGLLAAALAVAVATLPWWWGAALRSGAARADVTFGEYERVGYGRWAVRNVRWENEAGRFAAARVEAPHPLAWWWNKSAASGAQVTGWAWVAKAQNKPESEPETTPAISGWSELWPKLQEGVTAARRWLPRVEARDGRVEFSGRVLTVEQVAWHPGDVRVTATQLALGERALVTEAELMLTEADKLAGRLVGPDGSGEVELGPDGGDASGTWWEQPWHASARFPAAGWVPNQANVLAENWHLAGSRIGLDGRYREVIASARVDWDGARFEADFTASGEPVEASRLPEIDIAARASGTTDRVVIEVLKARAPGVTADLNAPLNWARGSGLAGLAQPAQFLIEVDVAELTANAARGRVRGVVDVEPQDEGWPAVSASLEASALQWRDWPEVAAAGEVSWRDDWLDINQLKVRAQDGSRLEAGGRWNVVAKAGEALFAKGQVDRRWLERWVPEGVGFEVIALDAKAEGTWPALRHEGRAEITELQMSSMVPTAWRLDWSGEGWESIGAELAGRSAEGSIYVAGRGDAQTVEIVSGKWTRADGDGMELVAPATLNLAPDLTLTPMEWKGPDDGLRIAIEEDGRWSIGVSRLEQAWLDDWVEIAGPAWFVDRLEIEGVVQPGGWRGRLDVAAAFELGEQRSAQVRVETQWDGDGVEIVRGDVSEGGNPIIAMNGRLPVTFHPGSADGETWVLDETAALDLQITSASNPAFWAQVDAALGIAAEDPAVSASLGGTWRKPTGNVTLTARRIMADEERWGSRWPELTGLELKIAGGERGLVLQNLTARIAGQEVRAEGRLPLDRARLGALREDPLGYLQAGAEGRIEIPDADLSAWAEMAPQVLAPTGTLSLVLDVAPGAEISGTLELEDAATRPLGPLGALQDVSAQLSFAGRRLKIEGIKAQTGGRPVVLQGEATWPRDGALSLDLTLTGQNLPLVRETGLLLRGDVDLQVRTGADDATRVTGSVKLRDGLFLMDLASLRPSTGGRAAAPARRPPYFTVEAEPFSTWRLDVAVTGSRFMRIETPVFTGRASADFKLSGSLREPRAVGEITVPDGRVKLPFATFEVTEGWVRLSESDPFVPRLSLVGTSRRLGYDLRMELSGEASQPNLQFFSSPPLASEEVLLLVMAGEAPQDEVNYSSSQRATKLGAYLGQSLLNQFTGNTGGEDRLTISTGERVSREGRETYRIEYEMAPRWSLVGEYDEFDDFNAGVRWKIFSPRAEEADAKP